ncbi:MAG: hypothetical protein Q8Q23_02950 [bacterium]|nr:hypothetical protein [bacterium]
MSSSYPLLRSEDTDGLVIHCSDPRFQSAFRQFIKNELGLNNPCLIIVPGGIHDLVSLARPKAARQLKDQLEFIIKNMRVKRIILINHDDCRWYAKWNALVPGKIGDEIVNNLAKAAEKIMEKKFGLEIEIYLAKIQANNVIFERLDTPAK